MAGVKWKIRGIALGCVICALCALGAGGAEKAKPLPGVIDFNRDIRPILSDNCYACHGPDKNKRKGDPPLRLDNHDGLFGERDHTVPVKPGKLDDSVLYQRIITDDPETRMPDPKSNKRLTERQIALIKKWIEQGAPWKDHWAYIPLSLVPIPQVNGASNPIDAFVRAKLEDVGFKPSPQADRVTLIRRLYFDVLGLPPTPAEVDDFVWDQSPDAYEKVVDRLLASPHFGERMAVHWLDLVRYADTVGYHSDVYRAISLYRDYVINSFNSNKPFDEFTIEQLAGDLLPNATVEQKIASGYNRLIETTEEGGAQPKEYQIKNAADRVRNVASVWLGSTMACCQCHDHKFDPFSQRDFYTMAAFFDDIKEPAIGKLTPELLLPNADQQAKLLALENKIAIAKGKIDIQTPELAIAQEQWEKSIIVKAVDWKVLRPVQAISKGGATLTTQPTGALLASGAAPDTDTYTIRVKTKLKGITAFRLEVLPDKSFPAKGPGRAANGNFVLTEFRIENSSTTKPTPIALQNPTASHSQPEFPIANVLAPDPKAPMKGWAILDHTGRATNAAFETATDLGDGSELPLTFTLRHDFGGQHAIGNLRLSATTTTRPVRADDVPKEIKSILAIDVAKRTEEQKKAVTTYYRSISPLLTDLRAQIAADEKAMQDIRAGVRQTLISISDTPRVTRILHRGDWMDETGDIVQPAVPRFFNKTNAPTTQPRATRLDLAHWLVARDNPLPARVVVNRLWKLYFGAGIASSLDDLGSQGAAPTHQELLDYLAVDFMDSGWDVKRMIKLMLMSETYQQTSTPSKELAEADPFNKYLARQGRFRLDAEFVRDNALSVSGLLSPTVGGESVKPYQPDGYWEFLNFPKRTYEASTGESEYRRGLYTHWQRTFLHPSLANFDAPSREECAANRPASNTPQQALTLLNDPTYVEAARVFAEHMLDQHLYSVDNRLAWAFRQTLSRLPKPEEVRILSELLDKERKQYTSDKAAAAAVLSVGQAPLPKDADVSELAAWTSVSRAILNLHETITRN